MPELTPDRRKVLTAQLKKAREIQSGASQFGPKDSLKVKTWWRAQRVVVRTEKILGTGASPSKKQSVSPSERRKFIEDATQVGPRIGDPLKEVARKSAVLKGVAKKALRE